jgi:predicted RNase H-like HicB family nuclease
MKDYHINNFYSPEDEGYIADIPDLNMCSAFGDTPEEALAELQIAKSLWLEAASASGRPIPEPRYRPAIYHVYSTLNVVKG